MDYMFMESKDAAKDEENQLGMPILVAKDRESWRAWYPEKGDARTPVTS